ncbi:unnamed protein product [Durusdinium trenchii]|uniref:Uncharacterized protein n=1 Tax=Durusdinium trenchii TaxID=1381693 RepID=A0ABP0IZP1_9DINO
MGPKSASSPNAVRGATAASTPKREAAKPEKTAKIGSPGLPGLKAIKTTLTSEASPQDRQADAELLRHVLYALRLRMRMARAVTADAQTKTQSAETLQAVVRMFLARSEMLSEVAAPWQPALQVLSRRAELDAQKGVSAVVKAIACRQALATSAIEQATGRLQAQRRACVAQREVQVIKDERFLLSIFNNVLIRQRLSELVSSNAAQTLQQGRRCQVSRRELASRQQERQDSLLVWGLLRTMQLRIAKAHFAAADSAVKLQTLRRGKVATHEVTRMREEAEDFSVLARTLRCLVLRIRYASFEEGKAALKLQRAGKEH